ncbi:MAG: methyltransferase, TIGR04325 family [Pontibacterium sp.]
MRLRFQGAYRTRQAAVAAVPSNLTVGYDNKNVVALNFELMCELAPWDYPVIYWLNRLLPDARQLLDAGGHMGTKYRAFYPYLDLTAVNWTIYDVPAVAEAGRLRANEDGLNNLVFTASLDEQNTPDIFLASGLLQYLDIPFSGLLTQLPSLPEHLLLNKVALHDAEPVFTLENFGTGLVPYQIRNREAFLSELETLGYRIQDQWHIPALTHAIPTHPEIGHFCNQGFYLILEKQG